MNGNPRGAGRKPLIEKRTNRSMKAFDNEWTIINLIADIYKHGDDKTKKAVEQFAEKYRRENV